MADVPNVQYINYVDTPLTLQFDNGGTAQAMLVSANDPAVDVTGFRKVSVLVPHTTQFTCSLGMGQVSPNTLVADYDVPLDGKIHTFNVQAPQMALTFYNGPHNTSKKI
jgi:hypothetical protein